MYFLEKYSAMFKSSAEHYVWGAKSNAEACYQNNRMK